MCSHRKDHRQISYHDRWIYYELSAFVCMCMCMACIIITLLRFYHILMLPFISFINLCWWWWRPGYVPMQFLDLMAWTGPGLASGIKIYLRYIFAYCLAGKQNQKETDVCVRSWCVANQENRAHQCLLKCSTLSCTEGTSSEVLRARDMSRRGGNVG